MRSLLLAHSAGGIEGGDHGSSDAEGEVDAAAHRLDNMGEKGQ